MRFNLVKKSKLLRREQGIALLTTLLLLFLMSSLLVGFSVLLYSNQKLAGSNDQQVHAFYAAEAGMEQLTAGLGNLFNQTYSPSIAQVNALQKTPPVIPGIVYQTGDGSNGYTITPLATDANGNPAPTITTIKAGAYQGMTAMATEYTLMVNARTTDGREVTLKRTTQTVGIPMFQFGIWSDSDLDFFPGPNFNFGGRTHTNGNLFLGGGSLLQFSDKVDAYKDVIRDQLENGHSTSAGYTGTVNITVAPGGSTYRALGLTEGSLSGYPNGTPTANPSWPTISMGAAPTYYGGNLQNGAGANAASRQYSGSAKQLNLGIVTIGGGSTQQIDLIRRPNPTESTTITAERYFAQASLRVLASDDPADIMNLAPCVDGSTQPFDLSKIAVAPGPAGVGWAGYAPAAALFAKMQANGVPPLPLAASGAANGVGGAFNAADGYMQPTNFPVIKGFLKIEEQIAYGNPCGTWKDVTVELLSYGYVGRNINPVPQSLDGATLNPQWTGTNAAMDLGQAPAVTNVPLSAGKPVELSYQNGPAFAAGNFTALSTLATPKGTCLDPHPLAVIRLERIRDNPSSLQQLGFVAAGTLGTPATNKPRVASVAAVCGVDPAAYPVGGAIVAGWTPQVYDFWPNTIFDTREGTLRDAAMDNTIPAPKPTLNGTMSYIELDGKNLTNWFNGKLGAIVTTGGLTKDTVVSPNDFVLYVSDRRGNYTNGAVAAGTWPPLSYTQNETGEYGWNDVVNSPSDPANGCPNNGKDTGEDLDGTGAFFTYGANGNYIHGAGKAQAALLNGQLGIFNGLVGTALTAPASGCAVPAYSTTDGIWPMQVALSAAVARENPALFFRRAVKIVNSADLSAVGACPSGVSCGLTIASENPVYIQGDFNANSTGKNWSDVSIPTSIAGDAVTLLSDQWNDINSFSSPYSTAARQGNTTWYRVAVIGGITVPFPNPTGTGQDYGTDGGVHNFLRYIEAWSGTLEYQGSIIELFTSRQAIGTFKCCNTVYSPPTRGYNFDVNFLNPTLLPPRTPLFRDVNTTGWTRLLLPGQYN